MVIVKTSANILKMLWNQYIICTVLRYIINKIMKGLVVYITAVSLVLLVVKKRVDVYICKFKKTKHLFLACFFKFN